MQHETIWYIPANYKQTEFPLKAFSGASPASTGLDENSNLQKMLQRFSTQKAEGLLFEYHSKEVGWADSKSHEPRFLSPIAVSVNQSKSFDIRWAPLAAMRIRVAVQNFGESKVSHPRQGILYLKHCCREKAMAGIGGCNMLKAAKEHHWERKILRIILLPNVWPVAQCLSKHAAETFVLCRIGWKRWKIAL